MFKNINFSKVKSSSASSEESSAVSSPDSDITVIGQGENTTGTEFRLCYSRKIQIPRLNALGKDILPKPRDDNQFDTIGYVMHCIRHDTIAVYQDANSGIQWFPFTPLFPEKYAYC